MFKTDIEYCRDILYINVEGMVSHANIKKLKSKMYHIINEYGIDDIKIDVKQASHVDKDAFYKFLDEYDKSYGGNLEIIEK